MARISVMAIMQCSGKLRYANAACAFRSMRHQRRNGRRLIRKQKPYRCRVCGQFHLADDSSKANRRPVIVPEIDWEDTL